MQRLQPEEDLPRDWKQASLLVIGIAIGLVVGVTAFLVPYRIFPYGSGLPIEVVNGFLTFDGIMIAAVAFLTQNPRIVGKSSTGLTSLL